MNEKNPKADIPAPANPKRLINNPWFVVFVPALIGLGISWFSVGVVKFYGTTLFIGLPIFVSFLAALFYGYRRKTPFTSAYGWAFVSILTLGGMIILGALDGLICLLMALPLAALLAIVGTALGRIAGAAMKGGWDSYLPVFLTFLLPCLVAFESNHPTEVPLRKVTTHVEIEGPIGEVWKSVIAFPRIDTPPDGIFRTGIAYPIEAVIEGSGIGAIRYCRFCTGDFVEPVTAWEENRLLAFDVAASPPPMKEFSIYEHVDPPHLHGHLASEKGQFRLERRGDKVLLEGTTWYRHEMWPQWYWIPMTDRIIHKVHHRVLHHIKTTVESRPTD